MVMGRKWGSQNPERDAAIYKKRLDGSTYADIAKEYGISSQRVRKITLREWRLEEIERIQRSRAEWAANFPMRDRTAGQMRAFEYVIAAAGGYAVELQW